MFKSSTKDVCRDFFATCKLSTGHFTEQAKQSIAKWGRDKVENELSQICVANADIMVNALKQDIELLIPESGEIDSNGSQKVFEHALVVMQTQISEIENGMASYDAAMEALIILAIFENPKTAASKTLELLKIWVELKPSLKDTLETAAKNILNFQGTKSYLTLLDFDTALFRILSKDSQVAFRNLQRELQSAMNKTSHEIRMEPSE